MKMISMKFAFYFNFFYYFSYRILFLSPARFGSVC